MLPTIQVPALLRNLANIFSGIGQRIVDNTRDRYWGVQMVPPESGACCQSAQHLRGRRFPMDKAPLLPLWDCTMAQDCRCRYRRLPERRRNKEQTGRFFLELDGPDRRDHDQ